MRFYEVDCVEYKSIFDQLNGLPKRCRELYLQYMESEEIAKQERYTSHYARWDDYQQCRSPIEQIFLFAFDIIAYEYYDDRHTIIPNVRIKDATREYIADFLYVSTLCTQSHFKRDFRLIVECDGHEFHERTKEQVRSDNMRALDLKMAGYDVIRFSGSQIYNESWKCADEVLKYIEKKTKSRNIFRWFSNWWNFQLFPS